MGLTDDGSYALIFCITFLLVACLTLVTAKIFDRTPSLPPGKYAPPFPSAAPLLPKPTAAPGQEGQCVSYCNSSTTGVLEPCESVALQTCTDNYDCSKCMDKLPFQNIQCSAPTQWPHVAAQQAEINNKSDKYCLPTRGTCINLPDDKPLQECKTDNDCLRCNDELGNGEKFACLPAKQGSLVQLGSKKVVAPYSASFCTTQYSGCDPQYGVAVRTSNGGWTCDCKYPNVMGGPACDQLVACNAGEVTEWSKDKQQLLLNMPGEDGSKIGDVWTIQSGVDPNKCIGADGKQVECTSATDTPTAACQCDGVHKGTLTTYTYTLGKPLTCTPDPCFSFAFGTGKTWLYDPTTGTKQNQLPDIPNLPVATGPQCSCSGFGSGAWMHEVKDNNDPMQGYKWKGYCQEVHIPNTSIVIAADADKDVCKDEPQANTNAAGSLLIPNVDRGGQAICVVDPCSGLSSDDSYRTNIGINGSFGHFDHLAGTCLCNSEQGAVNLQIPSDKCDRTVNPACSYCANACIGGDANIEKLCPVRKNNSCKPACQTSSTTGEKICNCGQVPGGNKCFWYNGECVEQKSFMDCCDDLHGVQGVCSTKDNSCRVVRSESTATGCSVGTENFVRQAIVCDHRDTCGSGWCGPFGKGPTCKCGDAPGCTTAHFKGTCGTKNPGKK